MSEVVPGLLDTNVAVRFLLNDHPEHSAASRQLFERLEVGLERAP